MTTIREKFELTAVTVVDPKLPADPRYVVDSTHAIGIEVEVENAINIHVPKGSVWQQISDGSLRNSGAEFITSPIPANAAPAVLDQLMTHILHQDCCFSPRTSVHIHLNVQDLETHQATDLVLLYTVFEKLLYKFAGRGRIRNIYCVPIIDTSLLTGLVEKGVGVPWSKYTGLNLCPLQRNRNEGAGYGTMEFRHMHGTFSVEKLCVWINLITQLKEYVLRSDTKVIRNLILEMNDHFDFMNLANVIFGKYAGALEYCSLSDVQAGYMVAKSAFIDTRVASKLANSATKEAPWYQFKGKQ